MTQLRMHLDGQARKLVEGLGCDGKGYAIALQTLKKRFGHRSLVAHSLMEEVTKGEVVPPNNRRSLSIFHTAFRNCIFTLNRMNFTSGLDFTENLRMAISRLPPNMRRSWAKTSQYIRRTEEPTLVHFEHWLSAEVEAAHDPDLPQDTKKTGSDAKKTTPLTRITTLATKSEETDRSNETQQQQVTHCPVCTASHHLSRCWKYKDKSSADKMSLVRAKKLCINCLRPGHFSQKCSSKFTCRVANCGKRHHTSLHDAPRNASEPTATDRAIANSAESTSDAAVIAATHFATTEASPASSSSKVFIQMVPVRVRNAQGVAIDTFALLDPCAEATLIRQDLAKKLGLDGPTKALFIGTILSESSRQPSEVVSFKVIPSSPLVPSVEIPVEEAWTVSQLNVPSRRQHLTSRGSRFAHI